MRNFFKIKMNPERIYGLDILRAIAILFVVIGHGNYLVETEIYKYVNYFLFDGVSLFFVLSGFLIGGILIKLLDSNLLSLKLIYSFWKRRWFRTIPNYFLILTILLILNLVFTENFKIFDKLRYYIFSQNLFYKQPEFFPEAWSLSIEEWFYLLTPLLIIFGFKILKLSVKNSILFAVILIIVWSTCIRYYYYYLNIGHFQTDSEYWGWKFRTQVVTRLDSMMYGVIGAFVSYYFNNFWIQYKSQFLILGIFIFIIIRLNPFEFQQFNIYESVFSFTFISIATLFLLPYLSMMKNGDGWIYRSLTIISLISYSMYLVNLSIVQYWILPCFDWNKIKSFNSYFAIIFQYFLYWFFTIMLSVLIYKYFEIPIMNLREKKN